MARVYRGWFSSLLRHLIGYLQLSGELTGQSCRSGQSDRGRAGGDCSMLDRRTAQEVRMHWNHTKSQNLIYLDKLQALIETHNSHAFTCYNQHTKICKATELMSCKISSPSIPQPSATMSIKERRTGKGRQQRKGQGERNFKNLGALTKRLITRQLGEKPGSLFKEKSRFIQILRIYYRLHR